MTTKKLVLLIAGVLGGIVLLAALFAGAIAGIVFYSISHSDAAATARDYLRRNEKLKREIGEVKDFGWLVSGSLNTQDADGDARLKLKAIGERRSVDVQVDLAYRRGGKWLVTDAFYINEAGVAVDLMNKYEESARPASD